jgi:hypothetical protein
LQGAYTHIHTVSVKREICIAVLLVATATAYAAHHIAALVLMVAHKL